VGIFVDANLNTPSRAYLELLREDNVEMDYVKDQGKVLQLNWRRIRSMGPM
jgi:hypothetical protein